MNLPKLVEMTTMKRSPDHRTMYRFDIPMVITEKQACEIQMEKNYHPAGYGFYGFKTTADSTSWLCGDSCD